MPDTQTATGGQPAKDVAAAAAVSGASYVNAGHAGASMAMAVLTGVALACYLVNLITAPLARVRRGARP